MSEQSQRPPGTSIAARSFVLAPWLLSLGLALGGVVALSGIERAVAVGSLGAMGLAALLAMSQLRRRSRQLRSWSEAREADLSTFADDRAAAIARQFEWAIEELVAVRGELKRVDALRLEAEDLARSASETARRTAEDARSFRRGLVLVDPMGNDVPTREDAEARLRLAEKRIEELTRALDAVTSASEDAAPAVAPTEFDWTLEYDGSAHTLRLRALSATSRPSQFRILDAGGRAVAETMHGIRRAQHALRIPASVAAAVESGDWTGFRLEARIDGTWHAAALVERGAAVDSPPVSRPTMFRVVS